MTRHETAQQRTRRHQRRGRKHESYRCYGCLDCTRACPVDGWPMKRGWRYRWIRGVA